MAFFQNMYYTCSCPDEKAKKCDRECHRFRLMTHTESNADRIRAMTDEELADFLWGIGSNPATGNYYLHGKLLFFSGNGNGWVDWLKQEIDYEAR